MRKITGYDPSKFKGNYFLIIKDHEDESIDDMEVGFDQIEKEDYISKRIGIEEDFRQE